MFFIVLFPIALLVFKFGNNNFITVINSLTLVYTLVGRHGAIIFFVR